MANEDWYRGYFSCLDFSECKNGLVCLYDSFFRFWKEHSMLTNKLTEQDVVVPDARLLGVYHLPTNGSVLLTFYFFCYVDHRLGRIRCLEKDMT